VRTRPALRLIALGAAALAAALALACSPAVPGARLPVESLVVGNARISAEIAATPGDREQGLMHRESMPEDHGMLFVFPEERVLNFWMKDTPLPLSIAFADAGGRILRIADMEPRSLETVSSRKPARYALEMNQGWFERNGVFPGDRIAGIPHPQGAATSPP
jgi:uncharacterized membrane protein (UPF0127 family)